MTIENNLLKPNPNIIALTQRQKKRLKDFNHPLKLWFWLLYKLPAAWFMGVRVEKISAEKAEISLPYGWQSQNPFNSIYFAAQAAAAEFSTGVLATTAITDKGKISMLVSHLEMEFTKKATSKTIFTCEEGKRIFDIVEKTIQSKEPQTITLTSTGVQATGEIVSIMKITWSFKAK